MDALVQKIKSLVSSKNARSLLKQHCWKIDSRVLDAGCNLGVFIDAVLRWCRGRCAELPEVVAMEVGATAVCIKVTY